MQQYGKAMDIGPFRKFVTDVCFLMFFGAFSVGAALAKSVRDFMGWLALTSAVGTLWALIAVLRHDPWELPLWWLLFNVIQLVVTGISFRKCEPFNADPGVGRKPAIWALLIAGAVFIVIFGFDLQMIYTHLPPAN